MVHLHNGVLLSDSLKFAGKWMEPEKNHPESGTLDPERETQYILTHKWILDVKERITSV